jgi:3,4-dihydroxy 2-butanone 4-phosphate synthase/GTP cyclohydrolase II
MTVTDLGDAFPAPISDRGRVEEGTDTVQAALAALRRGEFVVVMDDEDRENEGDLIMPAELVTEQALAFMVRHTSGLICVGMTGERLDALEIPPMVDTNRESMGTAFTVSVDLRDGISTGISARDRAMTIRALASADATADTFVRPGHVFPLRARQGGVLKRAGHTEAAVDLARLAGCLPAGVLAEIVRPDGSMARRADLRAFAAEHGLVVVTIADVIRYRRRIETLVKRVASARVPTRFGEFKAVGYKSILDGTEHVAFVLGEVSGRDDVLVRVHSECMTGDVFGSLRCDCGGQLERALEMIGEAGCGVVVYLRGHEGRGIGLTHKLMAYALQDTGLDTVDANLALGLPVDSRDYGIGAHILGDLGVSTVTLLTNNPAKYHGLTGHGIRISRRVPIVTPATVHNVAYLAAKRNRLSHRLGDLGTKAAALS